jgi:hypothetical protein
MMMTKIIAVKGWQAVAICQSGPDRTDWTLEVVAVRGDGERQPDWIPAYRYCSPTNAFSAAEGWLKARA